MEDMWEEDKAKNIYMISATECPTGITSIWCNYVHREGGEPCISCLVYRKENSGRRFARISTCANLRLRVMFSSLSVDTSPALVQYLRCLHVGHRVLTCLQLAGPDRHWSFYKRELTSSYSSLQGPFSQPPALPWEPHGTHRRGISMGCGEEKNIALPGIESGPSQTELCSRPLLFTIFCDVTLCRLVVAHGRLGRRYCLHI
jgi:hypothetical protein